MNLDSKIYVAGHTGLVGSSIVRQLRKDGYTNIIFIKSRDLDLRDKDAVDRFFAIHQPEYVFLAAAKVGGILGNSNYKGEFIYNNLMIQTNVIDSSYKNGTKKLLFLGSSCIYPKVPTLPITEDQLLTGPLEPTNDAYAIAKIAGITMCKSYYKQYGFNAISVMPCNLYGINDNFHPKNSHVLPGMIRRFHEAKELGTETVTCWGDGTPKREFLNVQDLASACVYLMNNYNDPDNILNVGSGEEISIKELAEMIAKVVGYKGTIEWDTSKPNGTMRKVMDVSKLKATGWEPTVDLYNGIHEAYNWYCENYDRI